MARWVVHVNSPSHPHYVPTSSVVCSMLKQQACWTSTSTQQHHRAATQQSDHTIRDPGHFSTVSIHTAHQRPHYQLSLTLLPLTPLLVSFTLTRLLSRTLSLQPFNLSSPMPTGHCLCNGVQLELAGDASKVADAICHCTKCTKWGQPHPLTHLPAHSPQSHVHLQPAAHVHGPHTFNCLPLRVPYDCQVWAQLPWPSSNTTPMAALPSQ